MDTGEKGGWRKGNVEVKTGVRADTRECFTGMDLVGRLELKDL